MQDNDQSVKPPLSIKQERQLQRRNLLDVLAMLWDDKNSPPMEGICKDISGSGILIELPALLAIDTHVRVSLHSHQNREHLASLNAKVVRAQKNKWGSYTTGLQIIPDEVTI